MTRPETTADGDAASIAHDVVMVEHASIRLATQAFGSPEDPALLLVMGATASMLGWPDGLCAELARRGLFVIRFDHRDTGESTAAPPGAAEYAVEDMAGDVIAILGAYEVERGHLMGMSLGGYISQMVALQRPERVGSLTLIASEPLGWDGPVLPHISQEILDHFGTLASLDWSDTDAAAEFLLRTERLCAGPGAPFDERRMKARIDEILKRTTSPASMFNHAALTTRENWNGRFRDLSWPVLVIHGEDDPVLPFANGEAIAAGVPGTDLLRLRGTGHELPPAQWATMADRVAVHVRGAC